MIVNPASLRRLFYKLGFMHALEWGDDKLRRMALALPTQVGIASIPEKYRELYQQLQAAGQNRDIVKFEKPTKKKEA